MQLRRFSTCIICGASARTVIVNRRELDLEGRYREHFFRKVFLPGTPDYILKDHVFFVHGYNSQLVVCNSCGLVSRDPSLSPEGAIDAYTHDDYHPEWLDASFHAYYRAFSSRMPELVKQMGSKLRVLEIGSQVGGFLAAASEYGWDAQGIDVSKVASDYVRQRNLKIFTGTISEAHLPDNSFDAVFIWLCFDQLPNPWTDLDEVHRVLVDGGWLLLKVPNGDFIKIIHQFTRVIKSKVLRLQVWKLLAYAILLAFPFQLGYTPASLRRLLGKSGFTNVSVRNQIYLPVTNPKYVSPGLIKEEVDYLKFTYYISEFVYNLSLRRLVVGPWIEVLCRKGALP